MEVFPLLIEWVIALVDFVALVCVDLSSVTALKDG
ncbi:hypothetical protein OROGR_019064 [Orobanche gracilis]